MSSVNKKIVKRTHEGGVASHISPADELRRTVYACMLWENQFYENGDSIADRISSLCKKVSVKNLNEIAVEARVNMKLRHAPLWLAVGAARCGKLEADTLVEIIQRADQLTEFLALYWSEGKCPISKQVKLGLAKAFNKFDEYQLAKYNRDGQVKLRDVLFMVHPKPKDDNQKALWARLVANELAPAETWENKLSDGQDKKETFANMIEEGTLGGMALLKNLRNMIESSVPSEIIRKGINEMKTHNILPFRFITAAKYAIQYENELENKFFDSMVGEKLPGRTILLVDTSYSMVGKPISAKSKLDRLDAACALAMIAREKCEDIGIYTFSTSVDILANRRGFGLRDLIKAEPNGGTNLGLAIKIINGSEIYDRIIVITDEQASDCVPAHEGKNGYILNVASYENGIGYGLYTHLTGFSEKIFDYIHRIES